jgi:hypothetical protein
VVLVNKIILDQHHFLRLRAIALALRARRAQTAGLV